MRTVFDLSKKRKRIEEIEKETQKPEFWQDKERAIKLSQELSKLQEEAAEFDKLTRGLTELRREEVIEEFEKKIKQKEVQVFLSGKYDRSNAVLSIYAGAGGQDAQDWATCLLRMYEKYCSLKGFGTKILHQSFGEGGGPEGRIGTKQVSLEIKGAYIYGLLKKESGVHRLVRVSPFSAKKLRHTSFALVEVIPEIPKTEEPGIEINPGDLKIETFRASGPGGQYVQKRETAVRITHLPTKIVVSCQSERLQNLNKEKAMELLTSKLYQLKEIERGKEISQLKGKITEIAWGNQIRSYVLHPYKMVKDLRTGVETHNVEAVLNGNLDQFIEAELKL